VLLVAVFVVVVVVVVAYSSLSGKEHVMSDA
jgi:hypothetical protein